jgi:hypothetical protein
MIKSNVTYYSTGQSEYNFKPYSEETAKSMISLLIEGQ